MVYIGNIVKAHQDLKNGFEINIFFKSNRISIIRKNDKIRKLNGDLRIDRYHKGEYLCTVVMDCEEIESFSISKEMRL